MALWSIEFTKFESGQVLIAQHGNKPSKQSTIGDRYAFPAGIANSVMSVSHF
jgi:hypothetical protein